jgi:hypothetical protein
VHSPAPFDGNLGRVGRGFERPGPVQCPCKTHQILGRQQIERLAVQPDQRGHAQHVPGVVRHHRFQRGLVSAAQEMPVARSDVLTSHVRTTAKAQDRAFQRDQAALLDAGTVQAPGDV